MAAENLMPLYRVLPSNSFVLASNMADSIWEQASHRVIEEIIAGQSFVCSQKYGPQVTCEPYNSLMSPERGFLVHKS